MSISCSGVDIWWHLFSLKTTTAHIIACSVRECRAHRAFLHGKHTQQYPRHHYTTRQLPAHQVAFLNGGCSSPLIGHPHHFPVTTVHGSYIQLLSTQKASVIGCLFTHITDIIEVVGSMYVFFFNSDIFPPHSWSFCRHEGGLEDQR